MRKDKKITKQYDQKIVDYVIDHVLIPFLQSKEQKKEGLNDEKQ